MFDVEPALIVHMLKVACLGLWCEDVSVVLQNGPPSGAALARIEQALQEPIRHVDLKKAAMAERVYALALMRNLLAEPRDLKIGRIRPSGGEALPPWLFVRWMAVQILRRHDTFLATVSPGLAGHGTYRQNTPPLPPIRGCRHADWRTYWRLHSTGASDPVGPVHRASAGQRGQRS